LDLDCINGNIAGLARVMGRGPVPEALSYFTTEIATAYQRQVSDPASTSTPLYAFTTLDTWCRNAWPHWSPDV